MEMPTSPSSSTWSKESQPPPSPSPSSAPSSDDCSRRRLVVVTTAAVTLLLILSVVFTFSGVVESKGLLLSSSPHRKLLHRSPRVDHPNRFWGDTKKCTQTDLLVTQGPSTPLPSGIPTYTVEIVNACVSGCDITDIHFRCGWFSSARLINPRIFHRLGYNNCLVNGGAPLLNGQSISFQYANTYSYPLTVSSMSCL